MTEDGCENLTDFPYDLGSVTTPGDRDDLHRGAALPAARGVRRAGERAARDLRARLRGVLGDRGPRARVAGSSRSRSSTSGSPRTRSGTSAARLNVAYNCVDRHVEHGRGDKVAYYWEGEPEDERREVTFADLQRETTKLANALKALGVRKGTPVGIYMGMVPETPIAMLACARIGAPHTVVFGGFSADSLSDRLHDMRCEVLITQDEAWRRGTTVPLKRTADEALGVVTDSAQRASCSGAPATTCRCRRGGTSGGTTSRPTSRSTRASRWTRRTCSTCSTRAARPRSRRGSPTRPPATSSASRRRTTTSSTSSPTRSTGAPPTSAGSPGTATSSTGRSATARPACSTRGRRTSPTRTAGGRSSSATRSTSSTRRRPRSART